MKRVVPWVVAVLFSTMTGCASSTDDVESGEDALSFPNIFGLRNDFELVSVLKTKNLKGQSRGHGQFALHKGHLVNVYGVDSGQPGGGFSFIDIKDPKNPKTVSQVDSEEIREPHGYGFARIGGRDVVALQAID